MGEGKKEGGVDVTDEEKNKEKEQEDEPIVLKVDMHCVCEACAKKVARALRGFQGVENVTVDRKTNIVTVKGNTADPMKLCERIHSKTGRNAQIISPLPKPPEEQPKDETSKDQKAEEKQDQPPPVVTVVLRAQMHCEACAHLLRKRIRKMKGVESVDTDVAKGLVSVKGIIPDPADLAKYVYKTTRKQVSIVNDEEKKEDNQDIKKEESKEEVEKKDEGVKNEEDKIIIMGDQVNRYEYYGPTSRYSYMDQHPNYLNDQPQFFSDENPNACFIM